MKTTFQGAIRAPDWFERGYVSPDKMQRPKPEGGTFMMRILLSVIAFLLVLLLGLSVSTNVYYYDSVSKINREARSYGVTSGPIYGVSSLLEFLEVRRTRGYFRGLTTRLSYIESDNRELHTDNRALQGRITSLSNELGVLSSDYTGLYSRYSQLEEDYSQLKVEVVQVREVLHNTLENVDRRARGEPSAVFDFLETIKAAAAILALF